MPRQLFFPIARGITRPFRPSFRNPYQGALWGKALGELPNQQTHELRLVAGQSDTLTDADYSVERRHRIAEHDFTAETVLAGIKLSPLPGSESVANSPVAVIVTHDKIINRHDGIFLPGFKRFLAPYIAYIEGKRAVLRFERFNELTSRGETGSVPTTTSCAM